MKFELSTYNKLWDSKEGRDIMNVILADPELVKANHTFWTQKFKVDPKVTPTNSEGEATFKSTMRKLETGHLMTLRAPLGDSKPEDVKGMKFYTGVIPEFISEGWVETAPERKYKKDLFAQFGDAQLVAQYAANVLQKKIDGVNQTLSHMAAQLLSTGKIVYQQGENHPAGIIKAEIPTENFIRAGKGVWTEPSTLLLDQIRKIYEDTQDRFGVALAMQLEIPRALFQETFMKNNQVIEQFRYINTINNTPLPSTLEMNEEMTMKAINSVEGLPKIVIVDEKQQDVINGTVHGWADNYAVLRPLGYAGYIRHTNILDTEVFTEEYLAKGISYSFTPALQGLATIRNTVNPNGNFKMWGTDVVLSAVPSLDEFLYHVIINTKQADE